MLDNGKRYHYVLIKNLNRLLGNSGAVAHPKNFCPYCCHGFDKRYLKDGQISEHKDVCFLYKGAKVIMPTKGKNDVIRFTNYSQQLEAPYTIYADFEAVLKKDEDSGNVIHEISGYSICVKSPYEQDQMCSYRGEDAGKVFIGHIVSLCQELDQNIFKANADMIYGEKEKQEFEKATKCHICEGSLKTDPRIDHLGKIHQWLKDMRLHNRYPSKSDVEKKMYSPQLKISEDRFQQAKAKLLHYLRENNEVVVRDHCHWTGKFRGAAHQKCNIMFRKTHQIPVFFHNFSGYDSHHIFHHKF